MGTKKRILMYIDIETIQNAKELGLNLSKVSENALKSAIRKLGGSCGATICQNGGNGASECEGWDSNPRRPSPEDLKSIAPLDYQSSKSDLVSWLQQIRGLRIGTIKQRIRHLDKFARPVRNPNDLVLMFSGLNDSQKRHLANAYRSFFGFCEAQGLADKQRLDLLRANLPKIRIGIDIDVPAESEVCASLSRLKSMTGEKRVFALYNLLLDSRLRLIEGVKLFNDMLSGSINLEKQEGFWVAPLAEFRGTKLAYYAFISDYTLELVGQCKGAMSYKKTMGGIGKHFGVVSYKYLRKFAFDTMTSERLNIPESVADFIEGRTPKTVGARHYMQLKRKAVQFYPRYLIHITELRERAFNTPEKSPESADQAIRAPVLLCQATN